MRATDGFTVCIAFRFFPVCALLNVAASIIFVRGGGRLERVKKS